MVKQLQKVGNSSAITLDKALMELVGLQERGEVQITVDHGSIILTPVRAREIDPVELQACMDQFFKERRGVLQRLAQ